MSCFYDSEFDKMLEESDYAYDNGHASETCNYPDGVTIQVYTNHDKGAALIINGKFQPLFFKEVYPRIFHSNYYYELGGHKLYFEEGRSGTREPSYIDVTLPNGEKYKVSGERVEETIAGKAKW